MMQEWLRSEIVCLDYAARAAGWLDDFFCPGSSTFQVAYSSGDTESSHVEHNAATSLIGIVLHDISTLWDISITTEPLQAHAAAARQALVSGAADKVLPLRSFGTLPLFSPAT